jgi:hypothetical protein
VRGADRGTVRFLAGICHAGASRQTQIWGHQDLLADRLTLSRIVFDIAEALTYR